MIGVSTDAMEDHRKFAKENGIEFPLVSDDRRAVKKAYGWGRVTYLIDKNGIVRFVQKGVPDNRVFLERLRALP